MWRQRHLVQKGGAFPHRGPGYHCCIVVYHDLLRAGTLLRIRVSDYHRKLLGGLKLTGPSWAVFRIVGANPALKSQCFRHCCGWPS